MVSRDKKLETALQMSSLVITTQGNDKSAKLWMIPRLLCPCNSGRLPYTIGKSVNDYSAQVLYRSNTQVPTISYSEGLFIDYRNFDKANIEPRFEFGFGLSYTTFAYANLQVSGSAGGMTIPSGPGTSLDPK